MTIWFTSDQHFFHKNILTYTKRSHPDIHSMNADLINKWNEVVKPADEVYTIGDFSFGKKEQTARVLEQLNGNKHLILGNHDKALVPTGFNWIKDYYELKVFDEEMDLDQRIVLFHYPILSWHGIHHGAWHLHGHSHGTLRESDINARLDVGVDCHNMTPISYEKVKEIMTKRVFKPVDQHI